MKVKVLVDNNTFIDCYYCGEPAVSYYIEENDIRLFFDVGYSDLFLKNANSMDLSPDQVDYIVISHGHDDHTGGLKPYFNTYPHKTPTILAHPDALKEKRIDGNKICSPILLEELNQKSRLLLSKEPISITDQLIFLGEIPSTNSFEQRSVIGKQVVPKTSPGDKFIDVHGIDGPGIDNLEKKARRIDTLGIDDSKTDALVVDDLVMDDSALVYQGKEGIYIITGCSHSGICNIIEYAKQICKDSRILGVLGGFHLFDVNDRVYKTIEYFKENNIQELYPCHCTSFEVKAKIHEHIKITEVGVGLELNWN